MAKSFIAEIENALAKAERKPDELKALMSKYHHVYKDDADKYSKVYIAVRRRIHRGKSMHDVVSEYVYRMEFMGSYADMAFSEEGLRTFNENVCDEIKRTDALDEAKRTAAAVTA